MMFSRGIRCCFSFLNNWGVFKKTVFDLVLFFVVSPGVVAVNSDSLFGLIHCLNKSMLNFGTGKVQCFIFVINPCP